MEKQEQNVERNHSREGCKEGPASRAEGLGSRMRPTKKIGVWKHADFQGSSFSNAVGTAVQAAQE